MAQVAASSSWTDPDGIRLPAGEVHAWLAGTNSTVCGLQLSRSSLARFPHVRWEDAFPESGGSADEVSRVCPRCAKAAGGPRSDRRPWQRYPRRP